MAPSYGSAVLTELGIVIEELILELAHFGMDFRVGDLECNEGIRTGYPWFHGCWVPFGQCPFLNEKVIHSSQLDCKGNAFSHTSSRRHCRQETVSSHLLLLQRIFVITDWRGRMLPASQWSAANARPRET